MCVCERARDNVCMWKCIGEREREKERERERERERQCVCIFMCVKWQRERRSLYECEDWGKESVC